MGLFTPKWMTDYRYTEKLTDTRKLLRALDAASQEVYQSALKALYMLDPVLLKHTVLEGKHGQYVDRRGYSRKREIIYDYRGCLPVVELKTAILTDDPIASGFPCGREENLRLEKFSARDLIEVASSGRLFDQCLFQLIDMKETAEAYALILSRLASGERINKYNIVMLENDLTPEQLTALFSATDDSEIRDITARSLIEKTRSPVAEAYVISAFHEELKEYLSGCKEINNSSFRHSDILAKLSDQITLTDEEERLLIRYSWKEPIANLLRKCGSEAAQAASAISMTFYSRPTDPTLLAQLDGDTALDLILQLREHPGNELGDPGHAMQKAAELIRYLYRHLADEKLKARIERELPQEQAYSINYVYQNSEGDLRDENDSGTVIYWP